MPADLEQAIRFAGLQGRIERSELLSGGFLNTNYRVTVGGREYVLRLYRTREKAATEAELMGLLQGRLAVPKVIAIESTGGVIGQAFAIMTFIEGDLLDRVLEGGCDADVTEAGQAVGRTLSAVGAITFDRPGFFGPDLAPDGQRLEQCEVLLPYVEERLFAAAAESALGKSNRDAYWRMIVEAVPDVDAMPSSASLVHADYNGKNILMRRDSGGVWAVAALIDWEFAFSGSPLWDLGNMLRFAHRYRPGFVDAFVDGYQQGGGSLEENWRRRARTLDVANVVEFVRRGPEHPFFEPARGLILDAVSRGSL